MEENKELIKKEEKLEMSIIHTVEDMQNVAMIMMQSGLFKDVQSQAQAFVKILAGQELGIGAFASMRNVYIIQGQTALSAGLMAGKIKAHPKYDYRIKKLDNDGCILEFYEIVNSDRIHLGDSSFDKNDMLDAGLGSKPNWKSYPRNMFFARAMSNGVRFYCPDIFYGNTVYTPEEINPDWAIDGSFVIEEKDLNKPLPEKSSKPIGNKRPYDPETLKKKIAEFADLFTQSWDPETIEKKRTSVVINLDECYAGNGADMKRHEALSYLVGTPHSKELTPAQIFALSKWLSPKQDSGGQWTPDDMAVREAQTLLTFVRKENGQMELGETK